MAHVAEQKEQLRESIKERLRQMSAGDRAAESRSICRRLIESIPKGAHVCGYSALSTEPDLGMLLTEILARGDTLSLPVFEKNLLTFRTVTDLKDLKPGELNIPEPSAKNPSTDPTSITIVLVPGRAFDRSGYRLGRGNGGYDVWIEKQRKANPKTEYWGVAFECQIVNEVPAEEHDQTMDRIVTARGVIDMNDKE
jgi:5-formyltetrahydrofolate cyclo-ligase